MSMRDSMALLDGSDMDSGDQEAWMEAEIQRELAALSTDELDLMEDPPGDELGEVASELADGNFNEEGLTLSMHQYVSCMKLQTDQLEADLDECDQLMQQADIVTARRPQSEGEDELAELAEQEGVDPHVLRRRILDVLDREDEEDKRLLDELGDASDAGSSGGGGGGGATFDPAGEEEQDVRDDSPLVTADVISDGAMVLVLGDEQGVHVMDTGSFPGRESPLAAGRDEEMAVQSSQVKQVSDDLHHTNSDFPGGDLVGNVDSSPDFTERAKKEDTEDTHTKFTLNPGEAVVAEVTDVDCLEKKLRQRLLQMDGKLRQKEGQRKQGIESRKDAECEKTKASDEQRLHKQEELKQEQEQLNKQHQEEEVKMKQEVEEIHQKIAASLKTFEVEMQRMEERTRKEQEELQKARVAKQQKMEKAQADSAVKIQSLYRGHRARREFGPTLNVKLAAARDRRQKERIEEIEQQRRVEEEEKCKEEDDIRKAAEDKRLEEDREQQEKEEMERKRQEEEKRKEELRRKEEERQQKEEEERKRKEEEKRRKEELKKEEERKKEELKRKEEKELKRKEEERIAAEIKKEQEKKKRQLQQEAERLKQEEKKREEEERKGQETARKKEEQSRLAEEKQREEERRRKEDIEKTQKQQVTKQKDGETESEVEGNKEQEKVDKDILQESDSKNSRLVVGVPTSPRPPSTPRRGRGRDIAVRKSTTASSLKIDAPPEWGDFLPEAVASRRLRWMKDCKPLSKIIGEEKTKKTTSSKKPPRRPISAKALPPLEESLILQVAKATSLLQVTTVQLQDLPGFSVMPLGQCASLRCLVINRCGLACLDGLDACTKLLYVDCKENHLEAVCLSGLSELTHLDLSDNSLSSIHGLDGCTNLLLLDLTGNKITRIGGLGSLKNLHTLKLANNQLITTRGLNEAPMMQQLDLSNNHLPKLDDVRRLALLQMLDLSGNNLMKVPDLTNHVLMQKLLLHSNSISSDSGLTAAWLPLLHSLDLSQNSLSSVGDLSCLMLLNQLDISQNQILDVESVIPNLTLLRSLQKLSLDGNPVYEDTTFSEGVCRTLGRLRLLDSVPVNGDGGQAEVKQTDFERMCSSQLAQQTQLWESYQRALSAGGPPMKLLQIHSKFFRQSRHLASEHRYLHEYGSISSDVSTSVDLDFTALPDVADEKPREHEKGSTAAAADTKAMFEAALKGGGETKGRNNNAETTVNERHQQSRDLNKTSQNAFEAALQKSAQSSKDKTLEEADGKHQRRSPQEQQAADSSRNVRQTANAASKSVAMETNVTANRVGKILVESGPWVRLEKAATKIQAQWRGYLLRKRLQYALNYAHFEDDDDEEEDDLDLAEIDMDAFNFNEAELDQGWVPPDMPQLPDNDPILRQPKGSPPPIEQNGQQVAALVGKPPHPPSNPRQAWRNESPRGPPINLFLSGKPPLPPVSQISNSEAGGQTHRTGVSDAHTYRTAASRKEEQLSEEWGFKDTRTAELMLQRAKKLKYNAARKKKLSQLDPKQRLALFRKLEEASKIHPVHDAIKKPAVPRKDYFVAREEEVQQQRVEKVEEHQTKAQRTYEWIHKQVGSYEVSSSRINQPISHRSGSDSNLPRMDPAVLAGGRAHLMGSPVSLELQSVGTASTVGEAPKPRRPSTQDDVSDKLPPIKARSAPTAEPDEKMSWRRAKVNQSTGWGGGKKRK